MSKSSKRQMRSTRSSRNLTPQEAARQADKLANRWPANPDRASLNKADAENLVSMGLELARMHNVPVSEAVTDQLLTLATIAALFAGVDGKAMLLAALTQFVADEVDALRQVGISTEEAVASVLNGIALASVVAQSSGPPLLNVPLSA